MGLIEECISKLVFDKTDHWDFNEITLSGKKIFLLSEINGKSSLKDLCKRFNIGLSEIKNIINELGKLNLIKTVINDTPLNGSEIISVTTDKQAVMTDDGKSFVPEANGPHHEEVPAEPAKTKVYRGVSYA